MTDITDLQGDLDNIIAPLVPIFQRASNKQKAHILNLAHDITSTIVSEIVDYGQGGITNILALCEKSAFCIDNPDMKKTVFHILENLARAYDVQNDPTTILPENSFKDIVDTTLRIFNHGNLNKEEREKTLLILGFATTQIKDEDYIKRVLDCDAGTRWNSNWCAYALDLSKFTDQLTDTEFYTNWARKTLAAIKAIPPEEWQKLDDDHKREWFTGVCTAIEYDLVSDITIAKDVIEFMLTRTSCNPNVTDQKDYNMTGKLMRTVPHIIRSRHFNFTDETRILQIINVANHFSYRAEIAKAAIEKGLLNYGETIPHILTSAPIGNDRGYTSEKYLKLIETAQNAGYISADEAAAFKDDLETYSEANNQAAIDAAEQQLNAAYQQLGVNLD